MSITALVFLIAVVFIMLVIVFGTLHYRIDKGTEVFYNVLLLILVLVAVGSGVTWIIS